MMKWSIGNPGSVSTTGCDFSQGAISHRMRYKSNFLHFGENRAKMWLPKSYAKYEVCNTKKLQDEDIRFWELGEQIIKFYWAIFGRSDFEIVCLMTKDRVEPKKTAIWGRMLCFCWRFDKKNRFRGSDWRDWHDCIFMIIMLLSPKTWIKVISVNFFHKYHCALDSC